MRLRTVLAVLLVAGAMTVPALGQSQPWKKQIALDANISIPGGSGDGVGTGFGGAAAFYYQLLTRVTFLSASVGYNSFDGFTIMPLLIGARYNFALTGFQPYIGFELGMYLSSYDNTVIGSSSDFGFQPKIGFRYPLSAGLDFDASIKYHIITGEGDSFTILAPGIGIAYTID
jgi:hypothetical protein